MLLDEAFFVGGGGYGEHDRGKCEVANFSTHVDQALGRYGWTGDLAACVVLTLNGDNTSVIEGCLVVRGKPRTKTCQIEASKVWQGVDQGILLTVDLGDLQAFSFAAGGLYSDFTDGDQVVHHFAVTEDGRPRPLLAGEVRDKGIGPFCLRLVCQVAKDSNIEKEVGLTYTLLIFPGSAASLADKGLVTRGPGWPGVKLTEGEMTVLPKPTVAWRCPILPLILPGTALSQEPVIPPAAALREAIAGIMRKAGLPDCCKSAASLANKWSKLERKREELQMKEPAMMWPAVETVVETGMSLQRVLYIVIATVRRP